MVLLVLSVVYSFLLETAVECQAVQLFIVEETGDGEDQSDDTSRNIEWVQMVFISFDLVQREYDYASCVDGDASLGDDNGVSGEVVVEFIVEGVLFVESAFVPPVHEGEDYDIEGDADGSKVRNEEDK